jgi:hypothetical protein
MNEPQPIGLFQPQQASTPHRQVEYVAPSAAIIDQYAHAVCHGLEQKFDRQFGAGQAEFIRGFATFVKTITAIQVKYLNRGGLDDDHSVTPSRAA